MTDRFLSGVHTMKRPDDPSSERNNIDLEHETEKLPIDALPLLKDTNPKASRRVTLFGSRTRPWLKDVLCRIQTMLPGSVYRASQARNHSNHDVNTDIMTSAAAQNFSVKYPTFDFGQRPPTKISVRFIKQHPNEALSEYIATCGAFKMTRTISIWRQKDDFDGAFHDMLHNKARDWNNLARIGATLYGCETEYLAMFGFNQLDDSILDIQVKIRARPTDKYHGLRVEFVGLEECLSRLRLLSMLSGLDGCRFECIPDYCEVGFHAQLAEKPQDGRLIFGCIILGPEGLVGDGSKAPEDEETATSAQVVDPVLTNDPMIKQKDTPQNPKGPPGWGGALQTFASNDPWVKESTNRRAKQASIPGSMGVLKYPVWL